MPNFKRIAQVTFPVFTPRHANMMPFIMGDRSSIPEELHDYLPMIEACPIDDEVGKVGYLTIDERFVIEGTHRRAGVHTEGYGNLSWGGGGWGGGSKHASDDGKFGGGSFGGQTGGLYIANSVPESCALYDICIPDTPFGGAVSDQQIEGIAPVLMPSGELFWMHDRTPHASLPHHGERQFFRLVTNEVSTWFAKHSTPNPLGVMPDAPIVFEDKFEMISAPARN